MGCGQLWQLVQALLPSTPPWKDFLQVCLSQHVWVCAHLSVSVCVCLSLCVCACVYVRVYVYRAPSKKSDCMCQ